MVPNHIHKVRDHPGIQARNAADMADYAAALQRKLETMAGTPYEHLMIPVR